MDLILKASAGHNIVVRPQGRDAFYPEGTVDAARVEAWWHYKNEPVTAARLIGTFGPGQQVSWPYNPVGDKDIVLRTISISAAGVRSHRDLRDAPAKTIVFQRETEAPTVEQVGESTYTLITLAIGNYSQFAIKRKVRRADDAAMTVNLQETISEPLPGEQLPRVIYLDRGDAGTGTRTVYVRVSHSSGGEFGAESPATAFTYADDIGAGGGSGDADPFSGYRYAVE